MENDITYYTVSQVTELTGVTAAQLKNWDKTGLLVAKRTGDGVANNRKLYTRDDIDTVQEILLYRSLGFGLEEIKRLLKAKPEERIQLVSERASKLKSDYSTIQKQIELTSALEVFMPETLLGELDCDDALSASDEYSKDENLRMMVRWMRSHTEQDAERLQQELSEVFDDLFALAKDAPWEEVQLQLLQFCDVWSKAFGWPSVGQMLDFARIFQDMANESDEAELELAELFDADACGKLSDIFYLAWADNALRVLDDILVCAMKAMLEGGFPISEFRCVGNDLGKLLCAYVCEVGSRPHLYKGEEPPAHPDELRELTDDVFALLEAIVLDAEIGQYLDIETLFSIEQQNMDFAHSLVITFIESKIDEWYNENGFLKLIDLAEQWYKTLKEYWRRTHPKELVALHQKAREVTEEYMSRVREHLADDGRDENAYRARLTEENEFRAEEAAFKSWVEEHYARVLADPPRPYWITEEEAIAHEKKMRALVQEMIARQEAVEDSCLEADE